MVSDFSEGSRVGKISRYGTSLAKGTANADPKERCGTALQRRENAMSMAWRGMCLRGSLQTW